MRFTGHLDLHRAWERIFRRAVLPIVYSQGYHPQPRLNLASALPLGFTSQDEVLDVWLDRQIPIPDVEAALIQVLPPGIEIIKLEQVEESLPSLQAIVKSLEYTVTLYEYKDSLDEQLADLISSKSILRERRGKTYDLRPLIEELTHIEDDPQGHNRLFMRLTAQSGATGRPEEVLAELQIPAETTHIHRTRVIFKDD